LPSAALDRSSSAAAITTRSGLILRKSSTNSAALPWRADDVWNLDP
jgi:hypothetical protein